MAGGTCFAFTTEVTPGAGTRIASTKIPVVAPPDSDTTVMHIQWMTLTLNGELISSTNPMPVTLDGETGTPFFSEQTDVDTTPGVDQDLASFVVPATPSRRIRQAVVYCAFEGVFKVQVNGATIGQGGTAPGRPKGFFTWNPSRPFPAGSTVKIVFRARSGSPITKVSAFMQCADEG